MPDTTTENEQVVDRSLFHNERNYGLRDVWIDEENPMDNPAPWWKRGVPIIMMLVSVCGGIIAAMLTQIMHDLHFF